VKLVTAGVSCTNCRHCHGLIEWTTTGEEAIKQVVSIAS
jgi:hypothetical protein